ncbi:pyridoxal 5'-phosphate synthase glutaminase subunit PdxT [Halomarina litorea]|uniref:pyridoxal 5'-phosphate synthase glutaminase subunit PdxT n=1 Tax=Halomarina litorea TaxID=2961595 RepID=UPI0020C2C220|nr:pyridoxal 5'-phosphate synthase glutaminase subunit PdxT [Halomarina sp. BCD28]
MTITAGVVAVQGDVSEHVAAIEAAAEANGAGEAHSASKRSGEHGDPRGGVEVREVRTAGVVPECDVLLLPGGESTTISRLLHGQGIDEEIRDHVAAGKPLLATCAGLIVVSRDAKDDRVRVLDLLDVSVDRNAFGRQVDSFEAPLDVTGLDDPFPAVFIRAPLIDEVGDGVEVLAEWEGRPVAVRQGSVVATSFHPELTDDDRIHRLAFFERALA